MDGRWKVGSGCMAADVLCVGIPGDDSTAGKPRRAVLRPCDAEDMQRVCDAILHHLTTLPPDR